MNPVTQKLNDLMARSGVPFKDIWFGSRTGHATFWSFDAALKAARMFQAATFTVNGPIKSMDQTKATAGIKPAYVEVYRIGLRLA